MDDIKKYRTLTILPPKLNPPELAGAGAEAPKLNPVAEAGWFGRKLEAGCDWPTLGVVC